MVLYNQYGLGSYVSRTEGLLTFLVLLIVFSDSQAQQKPYEPNRQYKVRQISVKDGLSQGSVYSMLKDSRGYMWMTSYEGLNRYDGHRFRVYAEDPRQPHSLAGNYTIGLVEDPYGCLWVGSNTCLNGLVHGQDSFLHIWATDSIGKNKQSLHYPIYADSSFIYYINDVEGVMRYHLKEEKKEIIDSTVLFTSLDLLINPTFCDKQKNIWVRMTIGLAMIPHDGSPTKYFFSTHPDNSFGKPTFVYAIRQTPGQNSLTFSSGEGVQEFSPDEKTVRTIISTEVVKEHVFEIEWLDTQRIWLGTNYSGLYLYDLSTDSIVQHFHKDGDEKQRLGNSNNATNMYADEEGLLWVSSDPNGVSVIIPDTKPFKKHSSFVLNDKFINTGGVRCFYELANKHLLIGTQEEGVFLYDPVLGVFERKFAEDALLVNHARQIIIDSSQTIWFATQEGLFYGTEEVLKKINFDTSGLNQHNVNNVWQIIELNKELLLAGTDGGLFLIDKNYQAHKIELGKQISTGYLTKALDGRIFVALFNDGFIMLQESDLLSFGQQKHRAIPFEHYFPGKLQVKHIAFSSRTQAYWVSATNGLYELIIDEEGKMQERSYFGRSDGLQSSNVYCCLEDNDGNFWISTNKGIHRINPLSREIQYFGPEEGIQGLEFNTNAFLKSSKGELFFGGVNGFNQFYPTKIRKNGRIPPTPIITDVLINDVDRVVSINDVIRLDHDENTITFNFYSPDYFSAGENTFEYQLENYDEQPIWRKGAQEVTYKNLQPQDYVFSLRVANDDLLWNPEAVKIHFSIAPPWWQRGIVRVIAFVMLGAILFYIIRNYTRGIAKAEQTSRRLAQLQLRALQAQMNPHFVFNCMNTIDGYIATNNRLQASAFISSFSQLIRKALQLSRSSMITVAQEVDFIKSYVEMEKERLSIPFTSIYAFNYPEEIKRRKIPPLSIQPIVENAIKHGLQPLHKEGILKMSDGYINGEYYLFIEDNGVGYLPNEEVNQDTRSLGLTIVRERFELISQSHSSTYRMEHIKPSGEGGTKIRIFIPKQTPGKT